MTDFSKMFSFFTAAPYINRVVNRSEINGLIISTCWTDDEGYETAIIDKNGSHPVERYDNKELSKQGHLKWIEISKNVKAIKVLGWLGIDNKEIIIIERFCTNLKLNDYEKK